MGIVELFLIAVGLSMDAFAVSICKGLSLNKLKLRHAALVGLYFGGFQALMPLLGWLLGFRFEHVIQSIDHWVAFLLLSIIGLSMIRESGKTEEVSGDLGVRSMLVLAVATSIDALAAGVSLSCEENTNIWPAVSIIGCVTLILSAVGVKLGSIFGTKFKSKAEFAGGVILILLGLKILLSDLGLFNG